MAETRAIPPPPSAAAPPSCSVCGRACPKGVYVLADGQRCVLHAIGHRPTLRRSLTVAAVVGTALFAINQLDVVLDGDVTVGVIAKILLTYSVPFFVATFAALSSARRSVAEGP